MLVKTDYKDRNNSIYKCDMCDKEIKNKHITRYDKTVYSDELRHSRFIIVDKFDLCPRCEKYDLLSPIYKTSFRGGVGFAQNKDYLN